VIALGEGLRNAIRQHGEADYPYECCGLVLGRFGDGERRTAVTLHPISNAREEAAKRNRFLIRPLEFAAGEKAARATGLDVVGIYHSHPDHPAVPSGFDTEHAWPLYSYLIVSVEKGVAVDLRSWLLEDDRSHFRPEDLGPGGS